MSRALTSSLRRARRRLPFGIGTVAIVAAVALVAAVGAVLAIGTPDRPSTRHDYGLLRSYVHEPDVAWTISNTTLPDYTSGDRIEVVATRGDRWLVSYPSGIGRAYLLLDRDNGHQVWDHPLRAGTGSCGMTADGVVGCAVNANSELDRGFYLLDEDGNHGDRMPLEDTELVTGVGPNFLRISSSGHQASMFTPDGHKLWSRSFAQAATATVLDDGLLQISTSDAGRFIVDPASGADRLHCTDCTITAFGTGVTVEHTDPDNRMFDSYAVTDGVLDPRPVAHVAGMHVLTGPSTLAVLTRTGDAQMQATQGTYVVVDPARPGALWQISDEELSKANTRPCGDAVAFALKSRARSIYALADGTHLGSLPAPEFGDPDANLDNLRCVGSSGKDLIFASNTRISAVDPAAGGFAWSVDVNGQVDAVDGFLVAREGSSMRVFAPN
ncbi:hypothetical protein ACLQ3C_15405 [Gordonia sp. DT30]|uniref:hypothetical protein n=1 Tax=Gordonia sp. DT30 TaxID=3416546 RepID=UPI003CF47BE4